MEDSQYTYIHKKLDNILEVQTEMRIDLSEHMRRTEIAEEAIEHLKSTVEPIQKHVLSLQAVIKFLLGTIGLFATIAGIYAVLK
jgi:hypothetical protein